MVLDPDEIQQLYDYARQFPAFTPKLITRLFRKLGIKIPQYHIVTLIKLWTVEHDLKKLIRGVYVWQDQIYRYEELIKNSYRYKALYNYFFDYYKHRRKLKTRNIHSLALANILLHDAQEVFTNILARYNSVI